MNNNIKIMGTGEICGGEYSEINVHGCACIKSDISFQKMSVLGSLDCNSHLLGKEFAINGSIKGKSKIKTEKTIVTFSSDCTCQTITSDIININPKKTRLKKTWVFSCESMSGEDIVVSNVDVKSIYGKDIRVEGKSHIQEIRYINECTISDQAVVNKIIKLTNV